MKHTNRFFKQMPAVLAVALVGGMMFASCEKEEQPATGTQTQTGKGFRLATENDAKTTVNGLAVAWVDEDKVAINGTEYGVNANGEVDFSAASGAVTAAFPASMVTVVNVTSSASEVQFNVPSTVAYRKSGDLQRLDLPMIGHIGDASAGSITMFHLCGAIDVQVSNTLSKTITLDSITVTAPTSNLAGTVPVTNATIAYAVGGNVPKLGTVTSGSKKVKMTFGTSDVVLAKNGSCTIQIPVLPISSAENLTVKVHAHVAHITGVKQSGNHTVTYTKTLTYQPQRAHVKQITSAFATSSSSLSGTALFTVSDSKKVAFSQGNLQTVFSDANTISNWQFASEQYGVIGGNGGSGLETSYSYPCSAATANNKINSTTSNQLTDFSDGNTIDLYTWVGANSTYVAYGIISNTDNNNYGNTFPENLKADWGANNISNGGGANKWRTLTTDEWKYLLVDRDQTYRYAKCTIEGGSGSGYPGMIIFPDGFTAPSGITINSANTANAAYTTNSFTADQWSTLQNAGCVFLPAAGYRNGSAVYNVGPNGNYWSSSAGDASNARDMYFDAGNVYPQNNGYRRYGLSVRLVQEY